MMKAIFSDSKQAFYRFATTLPIPPVPEDSWKEYITGKFREARIEIDEESTAFILKKTIPTKPKEPLIT
ncbi:MAG: hypothetical protein K6U04_08495 [Armatimonadetes bacterium]|nr:hypothetical protein [Armatimonadota bacterium]